VLRNVSLTQKCETTKHMKRNKAKWDSRKETRKNLRNETKFYLWRNETKRNFVVFFVSRNKRNFAKQFFCFALFRVSRNKKKEAKWKPYILGMVVLGTVGVPSHAVDVCCHIRVSSLFYICDLYGRYYLQLCSCLKLWILQCRYPSACLPLELTTQEI
jgi:hypothetical protein